MVGRLGGGVVHAALLVSAASVHVYKSHDKCLYDISSHVFCNEHQVITNLHAFRTQQMSHLHLH